MAAVLNSMEGCGKYMKCSLIGLVLCELFASALPVRAVMVDDQPSLLDSCSSKAFLSVSVSSPKRDTIPAAQLRLVDPSSREQGVHVTGKIIANSRYENVVELPQIPNRSRVHAIEVCGAKEGKYKITIYEHGDESYRLSVRIGADNSLVVTLPSRDGRVRECSFVFKNKNNPIFQDKSNGVYLMWLDRKGRPSIYLDIDR